MIRRDGHRADRPGIRTRQRRPDGLLVERVDYDGAKGRVSITFHPTGIKTLAEELANHQEERIA